MGARRWMLATMAWAVLAAGAPCRAGGDLRFHVDPRPEASKPVRVTGEARPIKGWLDFCVKHPKECEVDESEPEVMRLTTRAWALIVHVNEAVNREITPMTDMAHLGVVDSWDFPDDGIGDCEDFQLLKRRRLAEKGLPHRAMRMAVVLDEAGEGHAVLVVRTDRGDLVLDNMAKVVLSAGDSGYDFIRREGPTAGAWVALERKPAPAAPLVAAVAPPPEGTAGQSQGR